jgi:adenylate cyclase
MAIVDKMGHALAGRLVQWLHAEGRHIDEPQALLHAFAERAIAAGLPLARITLHIGTLHPLVLGHSYTWMESAPVGEEIGWEHGTQRKDVYLKSPLKIVFEERRAVRRRLDVPAPQIDFPVLEDIKAKGMTDYLIMPAPAVAGARPNAVSFATRRPGGFTEDEVAAMGALLPTLSLVLDLQSRVRTARTLLDTYVGRAAGRRVLDGTIQRGSGERIDAIILFCDMRESTALSERLPSDEMIGLLNDFFGHAVGPVHGNGGEVLKFIGDGFLAIFRTGEGGEADCSCRAVAAARGAMRALAEWNDRRAADGQERIGYGMALHAGPVMFGNIGAPDRLDFTVIGPAVNLAARLEHLTKDVGEPLVMSADFARICPLPKRALGRHALRGLEEAQEVFTLAPEIAAL